MAVDMVAPGATSLDVGAVHHRTLRLLFCTQILAGIAVTIGSSVGVLLARDVAGTAVSGLAQSAAVVGGALLAIPVTRIMTHAGRRPGLVLAYVTGATGAALVVLAAITRWVPLLFLGMLLFGGGSAANLQARYAAVDLAAPHRRARQLSFIVWATTIGAVTAPNLANLADRTTQHLGLPAYAGSFAFGAFGMLLAATLIMVLLRPDPLLTARRVAAAASTDPLPSGPAARVGMGAALRVVAARPSARLGIAAVAVGHLVMVGVMIMTPVHIGETHHEADVLRIVGLVLSLHIAGMSALAPVVGWLTDRLGRRPVILTGAGILLLACAVAGTAGHDTVRLTIGLFLLGLGWSCTMVAGSTLLSESVPATVRPSAQGLSDLLMGLAGALAGAASGFLVQWAGYPVLAMLGAVAVAPLVALALRPAPAELVGGDAPVPAGTAGERK